MNTNKVNELTARIAELEATLADARKEIKMMTAIKLNKRYEEAGEGNLVVIKINDLLKDVRQA